MPFFGITFYPDQWPEEYWAKAFSEIKAVGLDVVRFNEMTWDWLESSDGKFHFDQLDKALDLCQKAGLKVILGTATAQAPQWLIHKHQELRPKANDGSFHPEYGPRPNACRDNKTLQKYVKRLVEKSVKRYKDHPALFMWQLDNEATYPPLDLTETKDFCHCEATRQAFINWARAKYKNIDLLNQAWGTKFWVETFSKFEEISTPKAGFWDAGNPHIYLDWFRFKSDQISSYLQWLKTLIKKVDQSHKVGTNSFTNIPSRALDHDVTADGMEWFGWDIYPKGTGNSEESLAQIADYWRSVCQAHQAMFVVAELQAGPNVRWGQPGDVTPAELKAWTKLLVDHGAEGIMYFNWRPALVGSETAGFGLLNQDGTANEKLQAVKEIVTELKNVSTRTGTSPVPTSSTVSTAIYFSKASEIETYQEEGPGRPVPPGWFSGRAQLGLVFGLDSIAGAYRVVYPGQADFIFERALTEGNLPYKVIYLTNPYLLSQKQADHLLAWVNSGGKLITESRFGLKNEFGHLYETPLLKDMLDLEYVKTEIIEGELPLPQFKAVATGFRDIVKCSSGILACFEDKTPAIIEKEIGKGKVVYATFSLFSSLLKWENRKLLEFIQR